jgi:hypothetical protein
MTKKRMILFICSLFLTFCSNPTYKDNKEFNSFISSLKQIKTPLIFNSNKSYELPIYYPKENKFFLKLQEELAGFGVFGKLFETDSFIAILGNIATDTGTPVIITYNKKGVKIGAFNIYKTVMGDMGRYTWNYGLIQPDMKIVFIDSTLTRKINADGTNEIPGTDSLSVINKYFQINDDGTFQISK